MDTCGAVDPAVTETLYYCTLPVGHTPPGEHRCDYREIDPDNPPRARAATHSWTEG